MRTRFFVAVGCFPLFWLACGGATDLAVNGVPYDGGGGDASSLTEGGNPEVDASEGCFTEFSPGEGGTIESNRCERPSPCGGSLENSKWIYTGACADDPIASLKSLCPTAETKTVSGTVSGTLQFACGSMKRTGSVVTIVDALVPKSCAPVSCMQLGMLASSQIPGSSALCKDNNSAGCDCTFRLETKLSETLAYKISGNSIVTSKGTVGYCVNDKQLSHMYSPTPNTSGVLFAEKQQ